MRNLHKFSFFCMVVCALLGNAQDNSAPHSLEERNRNLTERLCYDIPYIFTKAEEMINSGSDPEGGLRALKAIDEWADRNTEGLKAVIKARTRTSVDADMKQLAQDLLARKWTNPLRAVGRTKLADNQIPPDFIRIKIPGMISQSKALLAMGKTDEGKKMLDDTLALVKENEVHLKKLTAYSGSNTLSLQTKQYAAEILSMKWYAELLPLTDKRTNPAYVENLGREQNTGPNQRAGLAGDRYKAGQSYILVKEQTNDSFLEEMASFMARNSILYLATVEGDRPCVRPIRFSCLIDNKLAVATTIKKSMSTQMNVNPSVELSTVAEDGKVYIRFAGKAKLCKDEGILERFNTVYPNFKSTFKESFALYLVTPENVGIWDGNETKAKQFKAD